MSTYYIVRDELSHHGVKGMKWGVRKQLPLIGRSRNNSKISDAQRASIKKQRAKKAAIIGGSVVAAGLVAYGGYKLGMINKHNKAASNAVNRALHQRISAGVNPLSLYDFSTKRTNFTAGNVKRVSRYGNITGHSRRVTKAGGAYNRGKFYTRKATDSFNNGAKSGTYSHYTRKADKAYTELGDLNRSNVANNKSTNYYVYRPINKLSRPKKRRIF